MSVSGTSQTAARKSSGRCVRTAATSRPPFEPPRIARPPGRSPPPAQGVLGGGDEVAEAFLFPREHAGRVPPLAVLAAAAQVRHGVAAAALKPQREATRVKRRRLRDVEAAVAV